MHVEVKGDVYSGGPVAIYKAVQTIMSIENDYIDGDAI